MNKEILECKSVIFFSTLDEDQFFSWLEKIDCILKVYGEGASIFLDSCQQVSHDDLRELIAIFHRYNMDMKQLKKFMNDENEQWLTNTKAYWYPNMFVN